MRALDYAAAEVGSTQLQLTSLEIINDDVFDVDDLQKFCPLDHGRHVDVPAMKTLGNLDKLPTELLHHVLGEVDVQSLLTFRCVSMSAMDAVNGVGEYAKVMQNASNSVRMAIAIGTASTFTFRALFSKLCQKSCDGKHCDKLAPYIDFFTVTRRCLVVGRACRKDNSSPVIRADLEVRVKDAEFDPLPLRSFQALCGSYNSAYLFCHGHIRFEDELIFYDYDEIRAALGLEEGPLIPGRWGTECPHWNRCSITAPWLEGRGYGAEYGVFCDICDGGEGQYAASIRKSASADFYFPNPYEIPFMEKLDYEEHVQKSHKDIAWDA